MNKREYLVIGGGTAGAISALYLDMIHSHRKIKPNITLVKSESIGTIGAGEGTTPHMTLMLEHLGISFTDLVREAKATVKNGIKFSNWRGGGEFDKYMHPFFTHSGVGASDMHNESQLLTYNGVFATAVKNSEDTDRSDLTAKAAKFHKVLFLEEADGLADETQDPLSRFRPLADYAMHFDSDLLAEFLLKIAKQRGVNVLDGVVDSYVRSENGDVASVTLEDDTSIPTDFIIDASGMARFFAKELGSEWVSWKDHLTVNAAMTFFLSPQRKTTAHTDAIAMDYGWMWQIPLQHRRGCGYVFDSTKITPEQAQEEIEKYLGLPIEVNRTIYFEPGYYKDPWKNNVLSVGLSSSFVEPLEATSIWSTILQLEILFTRPEMMKDTTQVERDYYNTKFCELQEDIASLINFHYMGRQGHNEFWNHYTKENATPKLKKILDMMEYRTIEYSDMPTSLWSVDSWYYVGLGIKYKPLINSVKKSAVDNVYLDVCQTNYEHLKAVQSNVATQQLLDHRYFLEQLGAPKWES